MITSTVSSPASVPITSVHDSRSNADANVEAFPGEVRSTSDYTVEQSWSGYSVYKTVTGSKAGTWEVQVLWGANVLASKKIKVE